MRLRFDARCAKRPEAKAEARNDKFTGDIQRGAERMSSALTKKPPWL